MHVKSENEMIERKSRKVLVTGAAGFIGMHVAARLLHRGDSVVGVDNLNDYYDVQLKVDRLAQISQNSNFRFEKCDISDRGAMEELFRAELFETVIHLAAQPGVRYSLQNPHAYINSNIVGFMNILEGSRNHQVEHLVYASSSSVYGANADMPFSIRDNVDRPVSLYAATKKSNELMAYSYSHLFQLPTTGLRFFTVYGPWGRPDMSPMLFARAIQAGRPIDVYNFGKMMRDFTYVDDIVEGVLAVHDSPPPLAGSSEGSLETEAERVPYRLYNIGNNHPVELIEFIRELERALGTPAKMNLLPMQPGDMLATYADISDLTAAVGFVPKTTLETGIKHFVSWLSAYDNGGVISLTGDEARR